MASIHDGSVPVGQSFEVYAPDSARAILAAKAQAGDRQMVRPVLHVEQVEAGKWEVVLQEVDIPEPDGPVTALLLDFFGFLHKDTDLFDAVTVAAMFAEDAPETVALGLTIDERRELVAAFLASRSL